MAFGTIRAIFNLEPIMSIKQLLHTRIASAMVLAGLPDDSNPAIALSTRPEFGDFQANGIMGAAKKLKKNPREVAEQVVAQVDLTDVASKLEIAGPGFINITLSDSFIQQQLAASPADQVVQADRPQTVVVDYSSPNLAKEMHVGHLRSTIIGDVLARLLEAQNHTVIRQNHMGDWGTQFGMLIAELEMQMGEGEKSDLALADLEVFYQRSKRRFDEDADFANKARDYVVRLQSGDQHCRNLWQQFIDVSVEHASTLYKRLGVTLKVEDIQPESAYNDALENIVLRLEESHLAVESDGALVVFLQELADKKGNPSPVIVRKSGGGFLYATTDLAAVEYRAKQLNADRVLYFIDARQGLHMKQVFAVSRKAGFATESISLEHMAFGMMLGKDGKPFKTRAGGTVKLVDLLDEANQRAYDLLAQRESDLDEDERKKIAHAVAMAAVKYADLSITRSNDYVFDWDGMISFEGNTGPYLQYAYARIQSVFKKADELGSNAGAIEITQPQERALALHLLGFNETLKSVARDGMPHLLCQYLYELATTFTAFYEHCPILKSEVSSDLRASRLTLAAETAAVLKRGLDILGIVVLDRM